MANTTYNLGRVGMNVRGEYSPAIAYQPMDIVTYQNGAYMAKAATTGCLGTGYSFWVIDPVSLRPADELYKSFCTISEDR